MGMWSQIHGKPNTLKGLAALVLDGKFCDEWQENDFLPVNHPGVGGKKDPWEPCVEMLGVF